MKTPAESVFAGVIHKFTSLKDNKVNIIYLSCKKSGPARLYDECFTGGMNSAMKIVCDKNELIKSISIVSKAVPVRTTMNILQCILIDAQSGTIRLTANDMELAIETVLEGTVEKKGIAAVDARMFSEIVRKLPQGDVIIETDDKMNVIITCQKAFIRIEGKEGDDFPAIPIIEKNHSFVISQFTLREIIRQTIFSISQNDTNPIMTGELFECNDNLFRVISLDGHRISMRYTYLKDDSESFKVIVPGKTLNEISKLLSGETEDFVNIHVSKDHIMFEMENTVIVSRLIEGNYFRVDQMIPTDFQTKVKVNRREFIESVERSILFVNEEDKKPIVMDIHDQGMDLYIRSQKGSYDDSILSVNEGKDLKIGFNPKLLIDFLRAIDDETVDFYFVNSKAPCVIRDEENTYTYLLLPVNIL